MNSAKKLIAMALAMLSLVGMAGGACACHGERSNATMSVTIIGDTITFVFTLDQGTDVSSVFSIMPRPIPFTYDNETGILTSGPIDVKLVEIRNGEVTKVIPKTHCPDEGVIPLRFNVSLNVTYVTGSDTITLGPFPVIRPDMIDPYDWGNLVIEIRPDMIDPY